MTDQQPIPAETATRSQAAEPRLEDLETRLRDARHRADAVDPFHERRATRILKVGTKNPHVAGTLFRIGVELVVTCGVGVWIGLTLDAVLGTSPWGLIGFFLVGAVGGMRNVLRLARAAQSVPVASTMPMLNAVPTTDGAGSASETSKPVIDRL